MFIPFSPLIVLPYYVGRRQGEGEGSERVVEDAERVAPESPGVSMLEKYAREKEIMTSQNYSSQDTVHQCKE